jgi:chemotaxis protein CheX
MNLSEKSILLLSDDETVSQLMIGALKPLLKSVVHIKDPKEAIVKATNQVFDGIILRTSKPTISDPASFFQWCQTNKNYKLTPWIVLGEDVEDKQILVTHRNVKFLPKKDDGAALLKLLEGIFFSSASATDAAKVDVNFINPLVGAVVEVLKSMAATELKRGTPYVRKPGEKAGSTGDISGVIAMNSDRFVGSLALCYEKNLILSVYANMLGTKVAEINDDVKDAVSELTNIIFGNAKRDLNAAGHTITPALPSVITGPNHEIRHAVSGMCLCVPFEGSTGKLLVECVISMKV